MERYREYRVAHSLGATLDRTRYRGLHADLPLVLSRKGYPYALNKKRRPDETGAITEYWAADSLQAYVTGLYKAAGTAGSSYSGRRTFATRLLAKGADIEKVQLLLGHEGIDQTRRYIDVDAAVLQRAFEDAF